MFPARHTPVTVAPSTTASWTANVPTPPDAPMTRTRCPLATWPRVRHRSAVTAARGRAAACLERQLRGFAGEAVLRDGGVFGEGRDVLTEHLVADLPGGDAGPEVLDRAGEVASADPLTRARAPEGWRSMSRATLGSPRMMCQSAALTDAAAIRTSTSPAAGWGRSTSSTRSTPEVP